MSQTQKYLEEDNMPVRKIDPATRTTVTELWRGGWKAYEIAKELEISESSVYRIVNAEGFGYAAMKKEAKRKSIARKKATPAARARRRAEKAAQKKSG